MTAACSLGLTRRCSGSLSWRMLYILAVIGKAPRPALASSCAKAPNLATIAVSVLSGFTKFTQMPYSA